MEKTKTDRKFLMLDYQGFAETRSNFKELKNDLKNNL